MTDGSGLPGRPDLASMTAVEKRALLAQLLEREEQRPQIAPLSFPQERLWFLDQLDPGTAAYNVPTSIPLQGALDLGALEEAIQEIVRRHETLRTTFSRRGHEPIQVIWPLRAVPLVVHDLRRQFASRRQSELDRIAAEEAFEPFDLTRGPLLRTVLVRLSDADSLLLITAHHIISDGWSTAVFTNELQTLYDAFSHGHPSPLPPLPVQYQHFACRQREELQGEVLRAHLDYWRAQLTDAPELFALPTDHRRPAVRSSYGFVQPFTVPGPVAEQLRALTREEGATLFMTLLAAFVVFLFRHTDQSDLVVGAPVANRNRPDLEPLIGFFVNTLILRTDASGDPTFRALLGRVREVALAAYAHQDVPFEKLVEDLQPERDLSRNPLFQVAFALQNVAAPTDHAPEVPADAPPIAIRTAKFDITLGMGETATGLSGGFEASADLFDATTVTRLAARFVTVVEAIAHDPDQPISELAVVRDDERTLLVDEWNRTEADFPESTFHSLFERQADETPDAVAAEHGDQSLTYAELDARANRLARHLRRLGAGPEQRVAICLERGLDMAVAVLGVMKSGAGYVPLDPRAPRGRIALLLQDSGATIVVTSDQLAPLFDPSGPPIVRLDADAPAIRRHRADRLKVNVDPLNLAYVIYTSGSTGTPKGILVPHRGVCNMAVAEVRDFGVTPEDRVLQVAPLIFDVSIWEMAMTWLAGATLVFATEEEIVSGSVIEEKAISLASFTPSLLATLDAAAYPGLRTVISVGEACSDPVVDSWAPGRRLVNVYGPTETTGHCATIDLEAGCDITIGRPIQNVRLYVLNEALQPVPIGVAGELYVSSPGTTRGYLHRPDLTAKQFVPDPFSRVPGGRLYRTGDLVRYLPDGRIDFLGRVDHQVKVRGFRIELGEIEYVLLQLPEIAEAVAVAREDRAGDKRLVAYVVAAQHKIVDVEGVRHELRQILPGYMVPSHIIELDQLPLNRNGKVDRAALPAPDGRTGDRPRGDAATMSDTEAVVAQIWEEVLGTEVGPDDNFFDLGGHSLLGTQVLVRLFGALGAEIPVRALFLGPTVRELAAVVDRALVDGGGQIGADTAAIRPSARRVATAGQAGDQ